MTLAFMSVTPQAVVYTMTTFEVHPDSERWRAAEGAAMGATANSGTEKFGYGDVGD